jgi:hypothetical protein
MTPSSLMTCEGLEESDCSTSLTSTSASPLADGSGSLPLIGTNLGRSRRFSTEAAGMTFPRSSPQSGSCDQPTNSPTFFTHITIWTLSMETLNCSSAEAERLRSENATLRTRILILEAEVMRLQAKVINVWGEP